MHDHGENSNHEALFRTPHTPKNVQPTMRSDVFGRAGNQRAALDNSGVIYLQRLAGNRAVASVIRSGHNLAIQREPRRDDDDMPRDRSRRSRPRNCPPGTVPIDSSDLDRETIHKIKDAIGAAPDTWVGVTPDGHIVTGDSEGNVEDHGHVSDYARSGGENLPKWVWALLGTAAAIALIVLFATGVGEAGVIVAGLGYAATAIIFAVLRASGHSPDSSATGAGASGYDGEGDANGDVTPDSRPA